MASHAESKSSGVSQGGVNETLEDQSGDLFLAGTGRNNCHKTSAALAPAIPSGTSPAVIAHHGADNHQPASVVSGDALKGYGELSPFVFVAHDDRPDDSHLLRFDAEIDIPPPRTHSELIGHWAAKSSARNHRAQIHSSQEATRPFSRLNRGRTTHLLMLREQRSRKEVEKAKNSSLGERGINESLTREMRGLNVLEQTGHPRIQAIPLLSRLASSAGSKKGRNWREMARITAALGAVEDDDHRAAAITLQGESLDDAWAALLGSTLETNRTVRSLLLNRNSIGDKGVAILARSLRVNSSVETVSLGGNCLTDEGARSFADLLKSGYSSLRALNLAGATPQRMSVMQRGSGATNPRSDKCIRAPGAAALALALGNPAAERGNYLLSLNLAFQRVWDAGAIALAATLKRPACHLEALGLSGTRLTDVAAEALSRALTEGKSEARGKAGGRENEGSQPNHHEGGTMTVAAADDGLQGKTDDKEDGAAAGFGGSTVVVPCPLRRLDLSRNRITDKGARFLATALQQNGLHHSGHSPSRSSSATDSGFHAPTSDPLAAKGQAPPRPSPIPGNLTNATIIAASACQISATISTITQGVETSSTSVAATTPANAAKASSSVVSACARSKKTMHGGPPPASPLAKPIPALATHAWDMGLAGLTTAATTPASVKQSTKPSSRSLVGLDLAFNCVGFAGISALHHALTTAAIGMTFLELRGNEHENDVGDSEKSSRSSTDDTPGSWHTPPSFSSAATTTNNNNNNNDNDDNDYTTGEILKEIENACALRREALRERQRLELRRRASAAVAAVRAASSSPRPPASASNASTTSKMWCLESTPEKFHARGLGPGKEGCDDTDAIGGGRREAGVRRLPGCNLSAAGPRPLEGTLPSRGYYVSPLLDSCFDLLMLREPVGDPGDLSLYVNRARDMLAERSALKEQEQQQQHLRHGDGDGRRKGRGQGLVVPGTLGGAAASAECVATDAECVARGRGPPVLKQGDLVSPVTISLEREHVLAERRRLYSRDSDFAARKDARVAGRGRSKASRSKLLTHKHSNMAFTRELLAPTPGGGGTKCPRGLRAHYLGLQNFEYDWGGAGSVK